MKNSKFHSAIVVSCLLSLFVLGSCGSDDGEGSEGNSNNPDNQVVDNFVINIAAVEPGVLYRAYEGGEVLDSDTSGSDGDAQLIIEKDLVGVTGKSSVGQSGKFANSLDSIVGTKNNRVTFKQTNVSLTNSTNVEVGDFEHRINMDTNVPSNWEVWVDGTKYNLGSVDGDGFGEFYFYNFEQTTTADSLIGRTNFLDFLDIKLYNLSLGPETDITAISVRASENTSTIFITPLINNIPEFGFAVLHNFGNGQQIVTTTEEQIRLDDIPPGPLVVTIKDLGDDGDYLTEDDARFMPSQFSYTIQPNAVEEREPNLTPIPQETDLIVKQRSGLDMQDIVNGNIVILDGDTDSEIASGTTDSNAEYFIQLPVGSRIKVQNWAPGTYKKTNDVYQLKEVNETVGDVTVRINVTADEEIFFTTGGRIPGDIVSQYIPREPHTGMALGYKYHFDQNIPPTVFNSIADEFDYMMTVFSYPTASYFSTPFPEIQNGDDLYNQVDPRLLTRSIPNDLGDNIGLSGTSTFRKTKVLPGIGEFTVQSDINLGSSRYEKQHEIANGAGFPLLSNNNLGYGSVCDPTNGVEVDDSIGDQPNFRLMTRNILYTIDRVDENQKYMQYSMPVKYEDN